MNQDAFAQPPRTLRLRLRTTYVGPIVVAWLAYGGIHQVILAAVRAVAASSLMSLAEIFWFRDYQWTAAEQLKWIPIAFLLVNGLLCLLISMVLARWLYHPEGQTPAPPK